MEHGARNNILGSPSGAQGASWGQDLSPGRPLDAVLAEVRRAVAKDQMALGSSPEDRGAAASAVSYIAANHSGGDSGLDVSVTGAALAVAAFVLKPGLAHRVGCRLRDFYRWHTEPTHSVRRWCINGAAVLVTAMLLMA